MDDGDGWMMAATVRLARQGRPAKAIGKTVAKRAYRTTHIHFARVDTGTRVYYRCGEDEYGLHTGDALLDNHTTSMSVIVPVCQAGHVFDGSGSTPLLRQLAADIARPDG